MKSRTLIFVLILSSVNTIAQIEKPITKGNTLLNGSMNLSYYGAEPGAGSINEGLYHFFNASLNVESAFFVLNKFAIGPIVTLGFSNSTDTYEYAIGIGPKIRYYFNNGIFIKTDAICQLNTEVFIHSHVEKEIYYYISPGIGYAIFLNPKVSFEPSIDLFFQNIYNGPAITNYVRFRAGLSIFL